MNGLAMAMEFRFVPWQQATELARTEPVVFAEILDVDGDACTLEIHVMQPYGQRLHEARRDDTGPVPIGEVRARVAQVATDHGCRYAAVGRAEKDWPPQWAGAPEP